VQLFRALVGKIGRIRAQDLRLVVVGDAEGNRGRRDQDLVVVFIFEALPKHVQMQCAEEAQAIALAEGGHRLFLDRDGSVVDAEPLNRIF